MFIEALCSINSGQADKGDVLDVCKEVGEAMIANGSGRQVDSPKGSAKKLVSPQDEKQKILDEAEAAKKARAAKVNKKPAKGKKEG